jgi:cytochrome c-type biogenesis protein CcmH
MFYAIAALMLLGALAFVLVPLLKTPTTQPDQLTVEAANLDAYRVQRRELDADFERGLISAEERDRVLDELSARLSFELAAAPLGEDSKPEVRRAPQGENASKRPWILGLALSLFILGGTATGYAFWGAHEARNLAAAGAAQATGSNVDPNAPLSDKQVLALVENLAKKMEENPSDPKGWILLARSQNALGQWAAAASAFERAVALVPNDAQLLADYADVQAMVQEGNFAGEPMALIQRALKTDPNNLKALALAGTAEMRANNKTQSLKYWEKLKALLPKDSDDFTQVSAIITEIKTGKPAFPQDAPSAPSPLPPPAPAPVAKAPPTPAAPPLAATAAGKSVSGEVTIEPTLASKIVKGDTLFVFARAANGPKMPLAVMRVPLPAKWPFQFELTDTMAMAPGMNLSSFAEVTIEARISKSGNASVQTGDLQGITQPIAPPQKGVKIVIDKVAR